MDTGLDLEGAEKAEVRVVLLMELLEREARGDNDEVGGIGEEAVVVEEEGVGWGPLEDAEERFLLGLLRAGEDTVVGEVISTSLSSVSVLTTLVSSSVG